MNTQLMQNILSQPAELGHALEFTLGPGRAAMDRAVRLLRESRQVYITGIGSSWHAGMAVQSFFAAAGRPVQLVDASELLHFTDLAPGSVIMMLSRSGKSVEIVKLLDKAAAAQAAVIGVTNSPASPLAQRADAVLLLEAAFDHNISITMYSALTLVGGLVAAAACDRFDRHLPAALRRGLAALDAQMPRLVEQIGAAPWCAAEAPAYFLARGGSLASCHETRLLWEEGAKAPACAMTTGGFRHGPQEMLAPGLRVGLWIDSQRLREADLDLAADLLRRDVAVMVVGHGLPDSLPGARADSLVVNLPALPAGWQFLTDIVPGQFAAERVARLRGVDCDEFRICPYVIEQEGGLVTREVHA